MGAIIEQIGIASFIFFTLFFVASILELIFSFLVLSKPRAIVKPFCLLFLIIAVAIALYDHPLLYVAIFFGFLGDIALLFKNKKAGLFTGISFFFVEHFLLFFELTFFYTAAVGIILSWWIYLIVALIYVLVILISFKQIYKLTKKLYLTVIGVNYTASLFLLLNFSLILTIYAYQWVLFVFIGYILFIISDSILTTGIYIKKHKRHHFFVMSTYLAAQFLIVLGFMLTYI